MFWLRMHGYLLCKYKEPEAVILHVDSKSANLGPRLSFISKFLEKAPFLAQNAYFNYRLEFEKDENTIDNTCIYIRLMNFSRDFRKKCRIRTLISTPQLLKLLGEI